MALSNSIVRPNTSGWWPRDFNAIRQDPFAHAYVIMLRARKGEPIDGAVRAARAAIPKTAQARTELASVLMGFVRDDSESVGVPVAAAALGLVNDALTLAPDDVNALEQKAEILRNQARHASEPERHEAVRRGGSREGQGWRTSPSRRSRTIPRVVGLHDQWSESGGALCDWKSSRDLER